MKLAAANASNEGTDGARVRVCSNLPWNERLKYVNNVPQIICIVLASNHHIVNKMCEVKCCFKVQF